MNSTSKFSEELIALLKEDRFDESLQLLKRRKKIDPNDPKLLEAFVRYAPQGEPELCQTFVKKGIDVNARFDSGHVLVTAVQYGEADLIRTLLDLGAELQPRGGFGDVPLTRLISVADIVPEQYLPDYLTCCELLLQAGADPNPLNGNGETPLDIAVRLDWTAAIEMLLLNGALVEKCKSRGAFAMGLAAEKKDPTQLSMLLATHPNLDVQDATGQSPLHHAVAARQAKSVSLLLSAGADTRLQNTEGATPFDLAKSKKVRDLISARDAKSPPSEGSDTSFLERHIFGEFDFDPTFSPIFAAHYWCFKRYAPFFDLADAEKKAADYRKRYGKCRLILGPDRMTLVRPKGESLELPITSWGSQRIPATELYGKVVAPNGNEGVLVLYDRGPHQFQLALQIKPNDQQLDKELSAFSWIRRSGET